MTTVMIRAIEPKDATALQALFSLPEVYRQTSLMPYPSEVFWQQKITPVDGWHHLVAELDGQVVGQVTIYLEPKIRRRHAATLGLAVHPDFSGRGIGRQLMIAAMAVCDDWLNVQRIELIVYTDNEVALRLYQKLGFVIEGRMLGYAFREGAYQDAYQMARCRWPHPQSNRADGPESEG